jgi:ribosomal protein S14
MYHLPHHTTSKQTKSESKKENRKERKKERECHSTGASKSLLNDRSREDGSYA